MLGRRDMEPIDELESSMYLDQLQSPSFNDSFHCPYTQSAILIDDVSTPSYCRSDASPRSFLYPLSSDCHVENPTSDQSSLFPSEQASRGVPSTNSNMSIASSNPWSDYSVVADVGTQSVESFVLPSGKYTDDGYEEASFALQPPSDAPLEDKPPPFYYDDDQYEDHVNIWASRVWTSSSGKEEDLESFLQAMELARVQLAHHQQHQSQSTVILQSIDEMPEVPHGQTIPRTSPMPLLTGVPSSVATDLVGPISQPGPILSPIFVAKLRSSELQWFDIVFLMPHEPLRQAMHSIRRLVSLKFMPFSQSWKIKHFFSWFRHFRLYVETQFRIKATVVLPSILGVNPMLREMLEATVRSYDAVLKVLDAVAFFEDLPDSVPNVEMAWASYILQLTEYLATLDHILSANLDRDELDFGQALASSFNHDGFLRQVQKKIEIAMPSDAKKVMVPWMITSCKSFGGNTDDWQWGWWSKWVYETQWRGFFKSHVEAQLNAIEFAEFP